MALHEVDENSLGTSYYVKKMANEFLEANMDIAEVDVPNGLKRFRQYAYRVLKRSGLDDKIKITQRKDKVFFVKK